MCKPNFDPELHRAHFFTKTEHRFKATKHSYFFVYVHTDVTYVRINFHYIHFDS
jgi:hypothetical protein